jgi:hypothetical protein
MLERCRPVGALELKFAAQTGVAIVPVMVEEGFQATGWLGILTAGLLWTKLWDSSTVVEDVDSLIEQIVAQTQDPTAAGDIIGVTRSEESTAMKDELLRLRETAGLEAPSEDGVAAELARIPALAPSPPAGILVTPEEQGLQRDHQDQVAGLHLQVHHLGVGNVEDPYTWIDQRGHHHIIAHSQV